jgi:anti-anti-sigma regulatory factor
MKDKNIIIKNELTIKNVGEIRADFIRGLSSEKKIILKSEILEVIDLAGIQFLLAVIAILKMDNKVSLQLKVSKESKLLIEQNGFKEILSYISNN